MEQSATSTSEMKQTWTKDKINFLIIKSPERVQLVDNSCPNSKSEVWSRFKTILVDNKSVEFVKCNNCVAIFHWNSKLGTSSLLRHKCNVSAKSSLKIEKDQIQLTQLFPKQVPKSAVSSLNESLVIGLSLDLHPLRTVEAKGFRKYSQALINFGAKYGAQKIEDVIQSRRTLKDKYLSQVSDRIREEIKSMLQQAPSFPKFAFTFDLWTDTKRSRPFISVTCHFIDSEFSLQSKLLDVCELPADQKKTTDNVREHVKQILARYFDEPILDSVMQDSAAVTDSGSNVIHVFNIRYPCMCHKLNNLMDATFDGVKASEYPQVSKMLSSLKSLTAYFKRSALNGKLQNTLKQSVPTRWNSELTMIKSYLRSADEVQKILAEKKQLIRLAEIEDGLLRELADLLEPFQIATDIFSREKLVTIDQVVVQCLNLQTHLHEGDDDSDEIKRLKIVMRSMFDRYMALDLIYYVALALHPRYKSLKFASVEKRTAAYNVLQEMVKKVQDPEASSSQNHIQEPSLPKKPRQNLLIDLEESDDENSTEVDEVSNYLALKLPKSDGEFDLIGFWRNANQFKKLRTVAAWVLAIPASSASDERTFSATGQTLTDRRTLLSGGVVANMTMINKNY